MTDNYILGAGPAGLIAAYYMPDHKVIDEKPLGQLNIPFIPGPRLLQWNPLMEEFVREVLPDSEIQIEICCIGYNVDGEVVDSPSKEFRNKYAKKTRDTDKSESSFLSEGMTEIKHIEIDGLGEDSYKFFFTELLNIIKDRDQLINTSVKSFNPFTRHIEFTDGSKRQAYNHIVSTLNLNILYKLNETVDIEDIPFDLSTSKKCFYKTEYSDSLEDMSHKMNHPSLYFDYVYSVDTKWTRQTFFREYIVYESVEPITDDYIEGNKVLMKFENLPIQIKESQNIEATDNIELLGRFAQWSHKMKANEVLDRVKEWIN
tara:strand:+ start:3238 stop:4185 length:948 start_codon:yes stop_codon:yes gene_type:complete